MQLVVHTGHDYGQLTAGRGFAQIINIGSTFDEIGISAGFGPTFVFLLVKKNRSHTLYAIPAALESSRIEKEKRLTAASLLLSSPRGTDAEMVCKTQDLVLIDTG